ncbi:MAG TPA: Hsp20/alpha crystallin family protein [Pyrinomonadaceae bacterium]|nr:Hsp20/alpha crystallin family protein [Pyrinomonadaceae bacterium]
MSQSWNPLQDLIVLQDRMNRLFEDATKRRAHGEPDTSDEFERADWVPASDIYETQESYSIAIDLPGVARSALEIEVDDNRLIVKGTREIESTKSRRNERPSGKFIKTFSVPPSVDQNLIGAEYKDGVLSVRLPKRQEQKPQKVEIKIS